MKLRREVHMIFSSQSSAPASGVARTVSPSAPPSLMVTTTARNGAAASIQQQQQQQQQKQFYPRHPAFTSNRLGGGSQQSARGGVGGGGGGGGFEVDRPLAGILVIGGILLFVSMSLTAAVIVFCKKKNTVFVLQKSEHASVGGGASSGGGGGDDSDLELDDVLADMDAELRSTGDLRCYTPLTLRELPRLVISVDAFSGERLVRCLEPASEPDRDEAQQLSRILWNPHARDSAAASCYSLQATTAASVGAARTLDPEPISSLLLDGGQETEEEEEQDEDCRVSLSPARTRAFMTRSKTCAATFSNTGNSSERPTGAIMTGARDCSSFDAEESETLMAEAAEALGAACADNKSSPGRDNDSAARLGLAVSEPDNVDNQTGSQMM